MTTKQQGYLIVFGLAISAILPFLFPSYLTLMAYIWLMIVLALTWDILGGQMGYNSFGNILFFGLGMYVCALFQRDYYASGVSEYTNTFDIVTPLTTNEYFISLAMGSFAGAIVAVVFAIVLGSGILGMRGQYFAICTLGLGHAAGEISGGIDYIGAGSGMVTPLFPSDLVFTIDGVNFGKEVFYYYILFILAVVTFFILKKIYKSKFGLAINAIRDNENKAESMGIHTTQYKILAWSISAFFLAIAGAFTGNVIGFIDPIEIAFAGPTFGVWMVMMAILGGKGHIWGPVLGAVIFYLAKEFFWTYFLGWQYVALGLLIVVTVVYFPTGILGLLEERKQTRNLIEAQKGEQQ